MKTFRSFRFFGDFKWPPITNIPEENKKEIPGVVEIFFIQSNVSELRALLRWTSGKHFKFQPPSTLENLPPDHYNVFNSDITVEQEFKSPHQTVSIWICEFSGDDVYGPRLAFRGGWLFEQTKNSERHISWLLQKNFEFEDKNSNSIEKTNDLIIGQKGKKGSIETSSFRFDLALPTPVQQSSGKEIKNSPSVFPISVFYNSTVNSTEETTLIRELHGRSPQVESTRLSFYSQLRKLKHRRSLGDFGFLASFNRLNSDSTDLEPPFINYQQELGNPDEQIVEYWPYFSSNSKHKPFAFTPLRNLGFSGLKNIDHRHFKTRDKYKSDFREYDLGIRFNSIEKEFDDKNFKNHFIYRIALTAGDKDTATNQDLIVRDKQFYVRLDTELGGWLKLANKEYQDEENNFNSELRIDIECAFNIEEEQIRRRLNLKEASEFNPWDFASIGVKLFWSEKLNNMVGHQNSTKSRIDGLPVFSNGTIHDAILSIRAARDGLFEVDAAQPQSFLPELRLEDSEVWFVLEAQNIEVTTPENDNMIPNRAPWKGVDENTDRSRFKLSLADKSSWLPGLNKSEQQSLSTQLWFPGLNTPHQNTYWKVALTRDPDIEPGSADDNDIFALFTIVPYSGSSKLKFHGRVGALLFDSNKRQLPYRPNDPNAFKNENRSQLAVFQRGSVERFDGETIETIPRTSSRFRFSIGIDRIFPQTVDRRMGDRDDRSLPLVIFDKDQKSGGHPNALFEMKIEETISGSLDRHLTISIQEGIKETDGNDIVYTVLADEPLSLFQFSKRSFDTMGNAGNAVIATYDSDDRTWQFKLVSSVYHYLFPAQSVGESADKPRRLEIHDLEKDSVRDQNFIRPYLGEVSSKELPLRSYVVDCRLTPSAELWIRPSDLERGYYLPEWQAHDIFRQRGDFGLGAALMGFRGEFLYGLSVGIDTSLESGPSRHARVAEIEALTGRLPDKSYITDPNDALHHRWLKIRKAIKRRHERIEFWTLRPDLLRPFVPARFEQGVQFALRHTALHRPPVSAPDHFKINYPQNKGPRYHEQGLAGGVFWPLESWSIFKKLTEDPISKGGAVERVALSPTGGDMDQTASFLHGIVKVISSTKAGFVQRQRVEILGRIGVFWHRAKHVVVYERTINPSAQFAPEPGEHAGTRTRRPVLRKVTEYIELLQPKRSYPDMEKATIRTTGFLDSVSFNSQIINVDSSWGEDVGNFGWKIPLWNRHGAKVRPQVYPRPDVSFLTAGEGDGNDTVTIQECCDPENIFFFTDGNAKTPDTDTWDAHLGVDYSDALPPKVLAEEIEADSKKTNPVPGKRRASVSSMLPGFRRFTWRLASASTKTMINAGRGKKPIYSHLNTITFMRASPNKSGEDTSWVNNQKTILKLKNKDFIKKIKILDDLPQWTDTHGTAPGEVTDLADKLAAFSNVFHEVKKKGQQNETTKVIKALDALEDKIKSIDEDLNPKLESVQKELNEIGLFGEDVSGFVDKFRPGQSPCDQLRDQVISGVRRQRLLILENIRTAQREVLEKIDQEFPTESIKISKSDVITLAKNTIRPYLSPLFQSAGKDIGSLRAGIEQARAVVLDSQNDVQTVLKRAEARIDELNAGYNDNKPWSPDRLDRFVLKLNSEFSSVESEILVTVEEARQRVAIEIQTGSRQVAAVVSKTLASVTYRKTRLLSDIDHEYKSAGQLVAGLRIKAESVFGRAIDDKYDPLCLLKRIERQLIRLKSRTSNLEYKKIINETTSKIGDLQETGTQFLDKLKDIESKSIKNYNEVRSKIKAFNEEINKTKEIIKDVISNIEALLTKITDDEFKQFTDELTSLKKNLTETTGELVGVVLGDIDKVGELVDSLVEKAKKLVQDKIKAAETISSDVFSATAPLIEDIREQADTLASVFSSDVMTDAVINKAVEPAISEALSGFRETIFDPADPAENFDKIKAKLKDILQGLDGYIGEQLESFTGDMLSGITILQSHCEKISEGITAFYDQLKNLNAALNLENKTKAIVDVFIAGWKDKLEDINNYKELAIEVLKLERSVRNTVNSVGETGESIRTFSDQVLEAAGNLGSGGMASVPNNILKLYSAATSSPELAGLKTNIDRIRCSFDELDDLITTTKADALFDQLGDSLKALGIEIEFNGLGDKLKFDFPNPDLNKLLSNIAGVKLTGLFGGFKIPTDELANIVRISHDFDKKQLRTWVQVDVDVPINGRQELFSVGVFAVYFRNSRLLGEVRAEASKDTEEVRETGNSLIHTNIDVVVSGQVLVTLKNVEIKYTKETGLKFNFDPQNIRLNPVFRFIQDTLGSIFPDAIGGLSLIKHSGIPIGVEHEFNMPNLSLMYGTSGVSNIQLANRFRLVAYPDFILADRFNLSTPELPFLFSFFIIGGTGYIQIDTEYRPMDNRLSVAVEAAVGGSAALGFAFGPVSGSVFIALSIALRYSKLPDRGSSGLAVSLVLVVAGNVSLWGIVHVYLGIHLRITYRNSGQVFGEGHLSVRLRVSRFIKLKYCTSITYKLRDGKSTTTRTSSSQVSLENNKLEKIRQRARRLKNARR